MKSLLFGTAGIPMRFKGPTQEAIGDVRALGLDAMEMEFVHSVNVSEKKAPLVHEAQKKHNILLTCHGSYYINLNSAEKAKREASKKRILDAARRAKQCGAWSQVFHAAFYQKSSKEQTYETVKKAVKEIVKTLRDEGNDVWIRPETTGKPTQFGDIDELLKLSSELEQVMPCVDFSHLHARSNGDYNTYEEFAEVLRKIEKHLGKEGLRNMHIHVSGIAYGEKGEKHHLVLKESDMNYKGLLKALKDYKVAGVVVCESPNIEEDALLLQKTYNR